MIFLKSKTEVLFLSGEEEKQLLCLFERGLVVGEIDKGEGEGPLDPAFILILGKPTVVLLLILVVRFLLLNKLILLAGRLWKFSSIIFAFFSFSSISSFFTLLS